MALEEYPDSWCPYCKRKTAHDGWGGDLLHGSVDIFCQDCGKRKETFSMDDASPELTAAMQIVRAKFE